MAEDATVAGWLVQVTIPAPPVESGEVVGARFKFFNVAISSAAEAVEVVRKKVGESNDAAIRVVRALSEADIAAAKLLPDAVKPTWDDLRNEGAAPTDLVGGALLDPGGEPHAFDLRRGNYKVLRSKPVRFLKSADREFSIPPGALKLMRVAQDSISALRSRASSIHCGVPPVR